MDLNTSESLLQELFPQEDTDTASPYGKISAADVFFATPTQAIVRLSSSDHVQQTLTSSDVQTSLQKIHQKHKSKTRPATLNVFATQRDTEFDDFGGWAKEHIIYKPNDTLVVQGDLPGDDFFLSHYDVLYLDGLPKDVTKQELTAFFQPYCAEWRDENGSIELVHCSKGIFTGRAFVGFDQWGEADKILNAIAPNNATTISFRGDDKNNNIPIQKVLEKKLPRGTKVGPRPNRSEEEILDNLHNWEQYVDPAHLQELYDHGIEKEMLNTAFLTMRYKNKSFGPVDLAMKGERLEPKLRIGSRYQNTVRKYVKQLRNLLTTQEKPGMFVESMFAPGEKIDITLIDGPKKTKKRA